MKITNRSKTFLERRRDLRQRVDDKLKMLAVHQQHPFYIIRSAYDNMYKLYKVGRRNLLVHIDSFSDFQSAHSNIKDQ